MTGASPGRRLWGLFLLTRPHACLTAAAGVVTAAVLGDGWPPLATLSAAAATVFLITGAGNAVNDLYDEAIDRVNMPHRPLPAGLVSRARAWTLVTSLFLLGLAVSLFLPAVCTILAVFNSALLLAYGRGSKSWGFAKNLAVGYLVGSVFVFAALAFGEIPLLVAVLAACAMLATLSREIVKDVEDLQGDGRARARTLPLRVGERRARRLAAALLAVALALSLWPWVAGVMGDLSLALVLLGGAVFAVAAWLPRPGPAQRWIMAGSMVELVAFLVARPL